MPNQLEPIANWATVWHSAVRWQKPIGTKMADNQTRRLLVEAAKRALTEQGFKLDRMPGRGPSNRWNLTKDGKTQAACIRTTQDRWFAFPPLENGTRWKTLDDVQTVVVSAVDRKEDPSKAQVFVFPATEVRKRFDAAYKARTANGERVQPDEYGMWVNLDPDLRGIASSVGSGLSKDYQIAACYPLSDLTTLTGREHEPVDENAGGDGAVEFQTIAQVIAFARAHISRLAGVAEEAVKLDLKIGY